MSNESKNPWRLLSSKVVHKNNWWSVRQDKVIRPDGSDGEYNVVSTPGAVMVVAMNEDQEIYLVGQFRYTTGVYSLEVPGGGVGQQQPLAAAKAELKEETGFTAKSWKSLGKFQTSNGLTDEFTYVFMATQLLQTNENEQEHEGIDRLTEVALPEALSMIKNGKITHAQTIVSLTMASLELGLQ